MDFLMKLKNILSASALYAVTLFTACSSEIPQADSSRIDNLPNPDSLLITKDYVSSLKHPCMLHTQEDFDRVKANLGTSPWKDAYEYLCASRFAQSTVTDKTSALLDGYLKRMDYNNWHATFPDYDNCNAAMEDAAKCYELGLRYKLSGDRQYADASVRILNAWAKNCKGYLKMGGYTDSIPDPNEFLLGIQGYQFANAAEMLRDYDGWNKKDFESFKAFMKRTYYDLGMVFLSNHNGGQGSQYCWLNWDLAQMNSILSVGILCDDNYMINYAINYFKNENNLFSECGNILNAVPYMHQDPDSDEMLGQCQESGRDQGHATLCVSQLGAFCQMALNVGEDLFAYADGRALAMAEYVAKFNLIKDEHYLHTEKLSKDQFQYQADTFPYTSYSNPSWNCPTIADDDSRGVKRPAWEVFYAYAQTHGKTAIYCGRWVKQMRELDSWHCDGGTATYDSNSGGYDQLGYGTLMFGR